MAIRSNLRMSTVIVSVGIATGVAFVSRWWSLSTFDRWCRREVGVNLFDYVPDCKSPVGSWKTNSLGLREAEPGGRADKNLHTVIYMGWVTSDEPWRTGPEILPSVLEQHLNKEPIGQRRYRVVNGAVPGGIFDAKRLERMIVAYRPQTVTYFFVPRAEHIQFGAREYFGTSSGDFTAQSRLVQFNWLVRMGKDPISMTLGPMMKNLEEMANLSQQNGVRFLLLWPGTGLSGAMWTPRLLSTSDGFWARFAESFKNQIGAGSAGVRRVLGTKQLEVYSADELGVYLERRMALAAERMTLLSRISDRLSRIIKDEKKL